LNASAAALEASPTLSTLMHAIEAVEVAERAAADGERGRALELYGQAVDDLLEIGAYSLAASTARDMLDRFPGVVRARGTLAVLSLAAGLRRLSSEQLETSRPQFELYITAARATGQEQAAICYLRSILEESESPFVREWLGSFLTELGDASAVALMERPADPIQRLLAAPHDATLQDRRWIPILRAPVRVPEQAASEADAAAADGHDGNGVADFSDAAARTLTHDVREELHTMLAYLTVAAEVTSLELRTEAYARIRAAAFRIDRRLEKGDDPPGLPAAEVMEPPRR
jgi:hypothetical protein